MYVSNGYIVFVPDIVYRIGFPGESAMNCVMPGVTSLIEKGFVDEKNIGIQGHSWGGYQIAYMVTRTNLFKAAEAGAPVANMISAYGGIRWKPASVVCSSTNIRKAALGYVVGKTAALCGELPIFCGQDSNAYAAYG